MINTIKFRGNEVDVEWLCVEDDPYSGSLVFEWSFYGVSVENHNNFKVTDSEEKSILEQIAKIYPDAYEDYGYSD